MSLNTRHKTTTSLFVIFNSADLSRGKVKYIMYTNKHSSGRPSPLTPAPLTVWFEAEPFPVSRGARKEKKSGGSFSHRETTRSVSYRVLSVELGQGVLFKGQAPCSKAAGSRKMTGGQTSHRRRRFRWSGQQDVFPGSKQGRLRQVLLDIWRLSDCNCRRGRDLKRPVGVKRR